MKNKGKLIIMGIFTGFCNGLFGSGGGMIAVPALEKYAGLKPKMAHATAIGVILPITVVSIFKYSAFSSVNLKDLIFVCIGGSIGSVIGAKLLKRFSGKTIKKIFGSVIIIAALRMVML